MKKKIGLILGSGVLGAALLTAGWHLCSKDMDYFRKETNGVQTEQFSKQIKETEEKIASSKVKKLSTKEEEKEITLHYKWEGKQPHLYYSVEGEEETCSFPGVPMKDEGNGWYSYTITEAEAANLILSVPELGYQTSEFEREAGEYWYDETTGWHTTVPEEIYTEPEVKTSTLQATEAPVFDEQEYVAEEAKELATQESIIIHYPATVMENAKLYYWNLLPTNKEVAWPGEDMTADADGYYSYTFKDTSKVNFLYTNGELQTEDFTIKTAGEYWYVNGKWQTTPGTTNTNTPKPGETETPATQPPSQGDAKVATFAETRTDFRDESIYFLMTTRFYDGDPGNNSRTSHDDEVGNPSYDPSWRGDFKGLAEKLDYIKSLGFTAIWITPVVKNWSQYDYHGYHAYNFKEVDSRYCSSDFGYQDLIDAAHAKGIKVIQDIVLNHVGQHGEENLQTLSDNSVDTINGSDGGDVYHHDGYIQFEFPHFFRAMNLL